MLHRNKYRQTAMDQRGAASRGGRDWGGGCGPQHRLLSSFKTFNWIDGLCSDSKTLQSRTAVPAQLDRGDAARTGGLSVAKEVASGVTCGLQQEKACISLLAKVKCKNIPKRDPKTRVYKGSPDCQSDHGIKMMKHLCFIEHEWPQSQLPFAELRQEQLMSLMPKMHLLFPLILVWSFWSDMMGSAQSFITSSWTFYLQANDGKILIFQSKPEIQYAPQLEQGPTNLRKSSLSKMSSDLQMRSSQAHRNYLEDGFLRCLSVNSKWILTIILILAIILILSVMVLLWICCAAVATAVEQYIPSEKLSIYGDLKFMNEQKLSRYPVSSPVVIRSKTEDHEEAGPLPTKMNLVHSEIKDFFFKENSHRHLNFHSS
ncbi:Transmembrane protein 59 [Heterocephalus glaber]|uniref:Transmembrane protein 59 n=1 Tax=Heterocephalus glaber TaxID=10181 RepID=G5BFI3_HETGA|nr:Transmembrane protein 59 [Heterocephalus glaber]